VHKNNSFQTLTFSFPTLMDAIDVAILIDGYCMLVNRNTQSLWRSLSDEFKDTSLPPFLAPHPGDFSSLNQRNSHSTLRLYQQSFHLLFSSE